MYILYVLLAWLVLLGRYYLAGISIFHTGDIDASTSMQGILLANKYSIQVGIARLVCNEEGTGLPDSLT